MQLPSIAVALSLSAAAAFVLIPAAMPPLEAQPNEAGDKALAECNNLIKLHRETASAEVLRHFHCDRSLLQNKLGLQEKQGSEGESG